ncbi:hypothetical protein ACHAPJ_009016, partial [Fusarium lateritium]
DPDDDSFVTSDEDDESRQHSDVNDKQDTGPVARTAPKYRQIPYVSCLIDMAKLKKGKTPAPA